MLEKNKIRTSNGKEENVGISSAEGENGIVCPFSLHNKSQLSINAIEGCQLSPLGRAQRREPSTHTHQPHGAAKPSVVLLISKTRNIWQLAAPFLKHPFKVQAEAFVKSWSWKARLWLILCHPRSCL